MRADEFWARVISSLNGVKESWLADKIGVRPSTLSTWKVHDRLPRADEAHAIASALGVTVEYLLTGSDSMDPWVRHNSAFIDDCKLLPADTFEAMQDAIHLLAEKERARTKLA